MAGDPYQPPAYEPPNEEKGRGTIDRVQAAIHASRTAEGAFLVAMAAWCVWCVAVLALFRIGVW